MKKNVILAVLLSTFTVLATNSLVDNNQCYNSSDCLGHEKFISLPISSHESSSEPLVCSLEKEGEQRKFLLKSGPVENIKNFEEDSDFKAVFHAKNHDRTSNSFTTPPVMGDNSSSSEEEEENEGLKSILNYQPLKMTNSQHIDPCDTLIKGKRKSCLTEKQSLNRSLQRPSKHSKNVSNMAKQFDDSNNCNFYPLQIPSIVTIPIRKRQMLIQLPPIILIKLKDKKKARTINSSC